MITLPKLAWQALALEPQSVATRAGPHDDRALQELIQLGGPVSVPVTADDLADDAEAAVFVRARAGDFSFHVVHLACAFRPLEDEPFLTVTVGLDLLRGDDSDGARPIALSMKPIHLGEPVEVSRTIRLGAALKIIEPGVEAAETRHFDDPFLEGMNELRPDPVWELRRTKHTEIRGSQRFVLVVQSPRDAGARGSVALSAKVRRKRLGVLPYTASVPTGGSVDFVLGE